MKNANYKDFINEYESYNINDYTKFKGQGKSIKDLLKRARKTLGDYFMVKDKDNRIWSVYTNDAKPSDTHVYAMNKDGEEIDLNLSDIEFIVEKETSDYDPPKYLVSPALKQDGSGEVDDDIDEFVSKEYKKSKTYFKPGIKSAGNDFKR